MRISDWSSDVCSSDLLILLDHTADAGDLGDSWNGLELVAQEPVLETAQASQVVAARAVDERIFVDPSDPGRIGPERARHAFGNPAMPCIELSRPRRRPPVQNVPSSEYP